MTPPHITLGQIAEKAGCSRSTVSRALRNHPHIPVTTCQRIQKLAQEMGWTPDPEATKLMRYLQSTKKQRIDSALALINDCEEREHLHQSDYIRTLIDSARTRAESLGFHLEEIWLHQKGMSARRINEILRARGINGVLIPPEQKPLPSIELDWNCFASVATTTTALPKEVNRVMPDNYYNMSQLMAKILQTGCKRPLLITSHGLETRMEHAPVNIFIAKLVQAGLPPGLICYFDEGEREVAQTRICETLREQKSDFIILPDVWIRIWLKDFSDLPWACFAVKPEGAIGVDQRPEAVGAAAIDVLTAHVIRGELGLPKVSRVLHIRGEIS
jgi:LacI family transcriptional regulator